jgi:hypothetical protein
MNELNSIQCLQNHDPYWAAVLFLFTNHSKLQNYLTDDYINIYEGIIEEEKLKKLSKPWSRSEKFVLQLALHLYSGRGKLDLNDIDYLDDENKRLVIEAMKLRFKVM